MVYCDPEELKWMPYVQTWMATQGGRFKQETKEYILDLFERYVEKGLQFVWKKCTQAMPQVSLNAKEDNLGGSHKIYPCIEFTLAFYNFPVFHILPSVSTPFINKYCIVENLILDCFFSTFVF